MLCNKGFSINYNVFKINKKNGKNRLIYSVDNDTKNKLKELLPGLERIYNKHNKLDNNYGFVRGKNCVQNALQHIGNNFTLSMDLENFFDSVTKEHVKNILPNEIIQQCFIDGAPRQGLPTSPIISIIAFLECDKLISMRLQENNLNVIYTRYADDMNFSFNTKDDKAKIIFIVTQTVEEFNFKINTRKTKLQNIKNGKIIITGIAIDQNGLYPTRKTKKKIRAAIHQKNYSSEMGLIEWAKCKLPKKIYMN